MCRYVSICVEILLLEEKLQKDVIFERALIFSIFLSVTITSVYIFAVFLSLTLYPHNVVSRKVFFILPSVLLHFLHIFTLIVAIIKK